MTEYSKVFCISLLLALGHFEKPGMLLEKVLTSFFICFFLNKTIQKNGIYWAMVSYLHGFGALRKKKSYTDPELIVHYCPLTENYEFDKSLFHRFNVFGFLHLYY